MLPCSSMPWKPATTTTRPGVEVGAHPGAVDVADARLVVGAVGADLHLGAGVGARRAADGLQRHGQQGDGDLLAGGQQHVEFPRRRPRLQGLGQADQPVGLAGHGGDDDHHLVPGVAARLTFAATAWMRSTLPTEVPPYF
jgi:hypothetical protein